VPPTLTFEDIAGALPVFLGRAKEAETFSVLLDHLRRERGLKPAEVYNGAWVDRRLYSKIMGSRQYRPAKPTVLALGLSLRLPLADLERLLERAGFCLSGSLAQDLVVRFCVEHGVYGLAEVNAALALAGQKPLFGL